MINEQNSSEAKVHPVHTMAMSACPFCGEVPELPSGDGTQYVIECDCGMASSAVQICDLMTIDERVNDQFGYLEKFRYKEKYVERARDYCIKQWNTRAI